VDGVLTYEKGLSDRIDTGQMIPLGCGYFSSMS